MTKTYFTKEHEWVKIDGNIATVGITDYAAHQLGDITFVELPQVGEDGETVRGALRHRVGQGGQ